MRHHQHRKHVRIFPLKGAVPLCCITISGKEFLIPLYWLFCSLCVQTLWVRWIRHLKVRLSMSENDSTVRTEIILYYLRKIQTE